MRQRRLFGDGFVAQLGEMERHESIGQKMVAMTQDNKFITLQRDRAAKQFNIFEAIGAADIELRHSDFLAYLFDSRNSHGFRDEFYRLFCKETGIALRDIPQITVTREDENRDLKIVDQSNRVVIIIENKIWSPESAGQLRRYRVSTEREFGKSWRKNFFFLTMTKAAPRGDKKWRAVDYTLIEKILGRMVRKKSINDDLFALIRNYRLLIKGEHMTEKEIEQSRRIYGEYREAVNAIVFHNVRRGVESALMKALVKHSGKFLLDESVDKNNDKYVYFTWKEFEKLPVYLEIVNTASGSVWISIYLWRNEKGGKQLHNFLLRENFANFLIHISEKKHRNRRLIDYVDFVGDDIENLEERSRLLVERWYEFLEKRLPKLRRIFLEFEQAQKRK